MVRDKKLKTHFVRYFFYLTLVSTILSCTKDEEALSNETSEIQILKGDLKKLKATS
jgi:hypothetical protein